MLSQQRTLGALMAFSIVMISPVLAYVGARGIFLAGLTVAALVVIFRAGDLRLRGWFPITAAALFLTSIAPALYWEDVRYLLSPLFLVFSLFLLQLADDRALDGFLTISTALMLVLLFGGVVGSFLALNGVQPLFDIPNGDGRPNYFFYTTFSNSWWGRIIRPSGVFDEPGAFSFMICGIAALRHLRGRDSRVTWLMLVMGFVTLSLAHLIYVLIHAMAEKLRFRNLVGIVLTLLPLLLIAAYLGGGEVVEKRLLGRVSLTETGELVGDNRVWRMRNAAGHAEEHPRSLLFGASPSCRFDPIVCAERFPMMGENPLSPLVMQGLFVSWPYYAALAVLFLAPLAGREYLVAFGVGALLLQRPFLLNLGYSLIGCLVVAVTIERILARRPRTRARPVDGGASRGGLDPQTSS
jgi:hypothetical protein